MNVRTNVRAREADGGEEAQEEQTAERAAQTLRGVVSLSSAGVLSRVITEQSYRASVLETTSTTSHVARRSASAKRETRVARRKNTPNAQLSVFCVARRRRPRRTRRRPTVPSTREPFPRVSFFDRRTFATRRSRAASPSPHRTRGT